MLKRIDRIENENYIYFEAVFNWGSIFAFTMKQLVRELENHGYSLN